MSVIKLPSFILTYRLNRNVNLAFQNSDNVLCECRVRFLSFMGIAMRNIKLCSFILHTANDQFVAHVFHAEPSAGALCKTIEAACKVCIHGNTQALITSHL